MSILYHPINQTSRKYLKLFQILENSVSKILILKMSYFLSFFQIFFFFICLVGWLVALDFEAGSHVAQLLTSYKDEAGFELVTFLLLLRRSCN